jgi:hypothetical protein
MRIISNSNKASIVPPDYADYDYAIDYLIPQGL